MTVILPILIIAAWLALAWIINIIKSAFLAEDEMSDEEWDRQQEPGPGDYGYM